MNASSAINANEFPEWVAQYVGLEFKEKGRDREGVDCWGLVRLILKEQFALEVPSYTERYNDKYDHEDLARIYHEEIGPWKPVTAARAGDVVHLRVTGHPLHVGLVVMEGWMIHVRRGVNAALERYEGPAWKRKLLGIYRHESMI